MNTTEHTPRVVVNITPPLALVRFNRPAERNKLSTETLDELDSALTLIESYADVRRVIFTGTDDAFLAGADITELSRLTSADALRFAQRGQNLFARVAALPQLTVAAINGYCFGGGLDFTLHCRLRYAVPTATFAHPGATLGIITGWGGTQRLPAVIGEARALEMFLTARRLTSAEALAWGLVHRICDDAVVEAMNVVAAKD